MSQASVQYLQRNDVVFHENSVDTSLYKIISGSIAFYTNYGTAQEYLIGVSSAPQYFGMMDALTSRPSVYTAVALEPSAVLHLPQEQLETFPKSDPVHALALMKTLASELCIADERLEYLVKELYEIVRDGGAGADKITPLLEYYPLETRRIIDKYELPKKTGGTGRIVIGELADDVGCMPEPYLKGHRRYPGVTHPEYRKYLIPEALQCPHCHKKFTTMRIQLSKLVPVRDTAEEKRYDLRVTYDDFETEWYEIITCPNCYFSCFEGFFHGNQSLYQSRYAENLARLCDSIAIDFCAERDLDAVFAQHYLALVCAPGFTDFRQIKARVWMNLVRLYRDAGELQLADIAEQKALEAYDVVYREVDLTEGQEQRLCLMQAGILYARGDKRAAREWAIRVRNSSHGMGAYWNLAEQLIQDVRAEMEAEKI